MACNNKITASLVNSCNPVKGAKKSWMYNRSEMTLTISNNEFSIAPIGAALLYSIDVYKDGVNAGHDGKIFENLPTAFINKASLSLTQGNAAAQANIDRADDICTIHLLNNGTIVGYGMKYGMYKTSQAQMANDNNGLTAVEFATREGMEEPYSTYFCTQSEAQLDALLT